MCMGGGSSKPPTPTQVPTPPSPNPLNNSGGNGVATESQKGTVPFGAESMLWTVPTTRQFTIDKHGNPHQNGPFNTYVTELPASAQAPAVPKFWSKMHGPLTGIPLFADASETPAQLSPLIGTQRSGSTAAINVASLTNAPVAPLPLFGK